MEQQYVEECSLVVVVSFQGLLSATLLVKLPGSLVSTGLLL